MTREEDIIEALRAFPRLRREDSLDGSTSLEGTVVIADDREKAAASFKVRVDVPPDFPDQSAHPRAWLLDHHQLPRPTDDAHVRDSDGYMCVQMEDRNEIHYAEVGLAGFLQQVVAHLSPPGSLGPCFIGITGTKEPARTASPSLSSRIQPRHGNGCAAPSMAWPRPMLSPSPKRQRQLVVWVGPPGSSSRRCES